MILTEKDLKKEWHTHKCKLALQAIDVPGHIINKFPPGRLLDYFVELTIMKEPVMHWRDALKWIDENRERILELERNEQKRIITPGSPD